ncbi:glycosyltransferase family 2 protein [Bacteroides acidifaciens]|jgi:glycosyltransferase involved in cell wall biosynthesis|uniref:glycosyltransferase family 2 protein n=1 Tax=Bacteroides acidifaciens TaxID=85831 RepID=UPI0015897E9D|nr:glycosyltransferase family 2 protein [Bacteroides acidifaciens]MDE6819654.1 glycosyltransferase family 2 protein [Bacteroides acidifaciens]
MRKGLVSIITPCYNTGEIIHRLLDSILEQDYPSVEMFVVDDGSTDNSRKVILSYISTFEKRGYSLEYYYQSNQGQSAAINNALKWVKGEFLTWPDSDDFYNKPDAISSFVRKFRELSNDYGVVRCFPTYVHEKNMKGYVQTKGLNLDCNQFYNCLYSTGFIWPPGNYMIKSCALDKVNPSREIYVSKDAGQNWQLFLPLLFSFKCYTLSTSYFSVLERSESHSRGQYKSYNQEISKISSYENTILYTLDRINDLCDSEKGRLREIIRIKYLRERLNVSFKYYKKNDIELFSKKLSVSDRLTFKEHLLKVVGKIPWLYMLLRTTVLKVKSVLE